MGAEDEQDGLEAEGELDGLEAVEAEQDGLEGAEAENLLCEVLEFLAGVTL